MIKKKRFVRVCRRCDETFETNRRYREICDKCKKPNAIQLMIKKAEELRRYGKNN